MKLSSRIKILALLLPLILTAATVPPGTYRVQGKEGDASGDSTKAISSETKQLAADSGGRGIAIRPRPPVDFTVSVDTDQSVYYVGEAVEVRFRASDDCRVYVFNTDSEGITRQVFPNYYDRDNAVERNRRYSIPIGRYWLVATGPPGTESLRIVAYRRPWRALEPWNEFSSGGGDPFPRRSIAPDDMRKRVESEAQGGNEDRSKAPEKQGGGGLAIVPIPRDRYPYDYAEDSTTFRVESPRRYRDPWYEDPAEWRR